jgi:hypothetical protein
MKKNQLQDSTIFRIYTKCRNNRRAKNALTIVKAIKNIDTALVLVGKASTVLL